MPFIKDLPRYAIFGGLTEEEMKLVSSLLREQSFKPGDVLFEEGQFGSKMYIIRQGEMEILKSTPQSPGYGIRLASFFGGDCVGEMSLLDIQPRSATLRVVTATECLTLSNRALLTVRQQNMHAFSMLVLNLARDISRRLRATNQLVAELHGNLPTDHTRG